MVFPVFFFLGSWLHCTKYLLGISHNFQDFLLILAENEVVIALQVSEVPYLLRGRLISIDKYHYSFVGAPFPHSNSNSLFGSLIIFTIANTINKHLNKHLPPKSSYPPRQHPIITLLSAILSADFRPQPSFGSGD